MKIISSGLTQRIIDLHLCGFDLDFEFNGEKFICVQSDESFEISDVNVCWSGTDIDNKGMVIRFIHTVACLSGQKGIFIYKEIFGMQI